MWRQSTQMEKRSKGGGVRVCRKKKKKGILVQKDSRDFFVQKVSRDFFRKFPGIFCQKVSRDFCSESF